MRNFAKAALLMCAFMTTEQNLDAQSTPSAPIDRDKVLMADYCFIVATNNAAEVRSYISKKVPNFQSIPAFSAIVKEADDNADRLTLYLSPSVTGSVPYADQMAAFARAESDMTEVLTYPACPQGFGPDFKACDKNLVSTHPALARIRKCNDLSWLPF